MGLSLKSWSGVAVDAAGKVVPCKDRSELLERLVYPGYTPGRLGIVRSHRDAQKRSTWEDEVEVLVEWLAGSKEWIWWIHVNDYEALIEDHKKKARGHERRAKDAFRHFRRASTGKPVPLTGVPEGEIVRFRYRGAWDYARIGVSQASYMVIPVGEVKDGDVVHQCVWKTIGERQRLVERRTFLMKPSERSRGV